MSKTETHPFNDTVTRKPGGIWGEAVLPILEWEIAERRVVVPTGLQASLTLPTPAVLRWAAVKYRNVTIKHDRDRVVANSLSPYLEQWVFHGEELGPKPGYQRILFQDENRRWYAVSIGPDRNGSHNMITVMGSTESNFVRNRLRGMTNVTMRKK